MPDQTQNNEPQTPSIKTPVPEKPISQDGPSVPEAAQPTSAIPEVAQPTPTQQAPTSFEFVQTDEDEDIEAQLAYETLKRRREARKRKRIIIAVVAGVVVLVGVLIFIMTQANKAATESGEEVLATGTAYEGEFATTVTANGATEPVNSTVVSPEVDGIVENLSVQEGDTVQEGDVLFTLKNETLDKDIRDAETELQTAQRAVDSANRAVNDAYDSYNKAVDEYNQAQQTTNTVMVENEDGSVSETEVESTATFDENSLRSAIDSAEDTYQSALETRNAAQSKLDETKKTADKRTVRAPVSGTIVSLNAKNGMAYGSGAGAASSASSAAGSDGTLMQISDLSQMKVTVEVNEVDISKIAKGQTAKATFSAIPGLELDATVEHIASVSSGSASADGSGGGGVVNYAVDLLIPKPDGKLKPGMTATVNITTQSVPNAIVVPSAAVHDGTTDDGAAGKFVTILDNAETKQTHEVPVEVVAENSSEAAIKGDVHDGDTVMLSSLGGSSTDLATLEAEATAAGATDTETAG